MPPVALISIPKGRLSRLPSFRAQLSSADKVGYVVERFMIPQPEISVVGRGSLFATRKKPLDSRFCAPPISSRRSATTLPYRRSQTGLCEILHP